MFQATAKRRGALAVVLQLDVVTCSESVINILLIQKDNHWQPDQGRDCKKI